MKNKILYTVAALALGFTATSCRDESLLTYGAGEGKMTLHTSVMSEIKVVSRALSEEQQNQLCSSALIWISDAQKGLLYKYNGLSTFPAEGLSLTSGSYVAEAWVGDSIPASWTGVRYHGREIFDITAGVTTPVNLVCPVRNTLVSVKLADKLTELLSDVSFTVSLNDGITDGSHSLTFEGDKLGDKGYYMINTRTKGFTWTITGTDVTGKTFTRSGEYKDPAIEDAPYLSRSTEYIFNVKYDAEEGEVEIGGAYLDIEVNPEPVEGVEQEVLISLAPEIVGLEGLDLSRTIMGEPGSIGRKSIHVIGAAALKNVVISGSLLPAVNLDASYDLLTMNDSYVDVLSATGLNFATYDNSADKDENNPVITNLRLNLEEVLTNSLSAGEYELNIQATDVDGRSSNTVVSFNISDAPGQPLDVNPLTDIDYTSVTLPAEVTKPGEVMGFEVKKLSSSRLFEDWTFVEGVLEGTILRAHVTGLENGTEYVYRLVVDDYVSAQEFKVTTLAYPQLPNAGFEDWFTGKADPSNYDGTQLPCADPATRFWDCGNHGSMKLKINVTTPDESVKHSGRYSIKMQSDYPSMFGIGKFAAGNVFTGMYLKTDGTDGVLGWGREFSSPVRPKALRGYVRYEPQAVTDTSLDYVAKGDMDTGIIRFALLTDELAGDNDFPTWPVVVKTKTKQLFVGNESNVVAYGEKVIEGTTPGSGMVEFEIPLTDVNGSLEFKNILIVASASRYGDYFTGGRGSTMWLDDLELVY